MTERARANASKFRALLRYKIRLCERSSGLRQAQSYWIASLSLAKTAFRLICNHKMGLPCRKGIGDAHTILVLSIHLNCLLFKLIFNL
jgi:hypothetical protein